MEYIIKDIKGRQILDSRGNPTVEAELLVEQQFQVELQQGQAKHLSFEMAIQLLVEKL